MMMMMMMNNNNNKESEENLTIRPYPAQSPGFSLTQNRESDGGYDPGPALSSWPLTPARHALTNITVSFDDKIDKRLYMFETEVASFSLEIYLRRILLI